MAEVKITTKPVSTEYDYVYGEKDGAVKRIPKSSMGADAETVSFDAETVSLTWIADKAYNLNTGVLANASGNRYTEKASITGGDVILINHHRGQILWWSDNTYLGYVITSNTAGKCFVAPANATEYALNSHAQATQAQIASSIDIMHFDTQFCKITRTAPAKLIVGSDAFVNKKYVQHDSGLIYFGDSFATFYCAVPIPVKPNHRYRTETQTQIVFYDNTMTYLSYILPNNDSNLTGVKTEMDFTTPINCAYIAISSRNAHEKLFDLEYEDKAVSEKKLIGKSVVCFGDSITGNYGFGDNYPYQIEEITGAKTYNVGFGGCRMQLLRNDASHTNPFSMCGLVDAIASNTWTDQDQYATNLSRMAYFRLQILKAIDFSEVDIVTIAYGTNELGYPQDDPDDPQNKYTYAGATRYCIEKLLSINPKLRILLLTPIYRYFASEQKDSDTYTHPIYGGKLTDNVATLISVGHEQKIPVIDMYYSLGINLTNHTAYFGDDDEQSDGTHINSFGREQFGRRVAGEMIRLF